VNLKYSFLLLGIVLLSSGCVQVQAKYQWGGYEQALYDYYKTPAEIERYAEELADTISDGELEGKVPPGIYAEFAYILMLQGDGKKAISYFEKEKKLWPESAQFMDLMIKNAKTYKYKKPEETKSKKTTGGDG